MVNLLRAHPLNVDSCKVQEQVGSLTESLLFSSSSMLRNEWSFYNGFTENLIWTQVFKERLQPIMEYKGIRKIMFILLIH